MSGNPCVKTGVMFRDSETGLVHTGDLFRFGDCWQVRGIPLRPDGALAESDREADIEIEGARYTKRLPRWCDTQYGARIVAVSDDFREHISKWYGDLLDCMPVASTTPPKAA